MKRICRIRIAHHPQSQGKSLFGSIILGIEIFGDSGIVFDIRILRKDASMFL